MLKFRHKTVSDIVEICVDQHSDLWSCQNMQPPLQKDVNYVAGAWPRVVSSTHFFHGKAFSIYLMSYVVFCLSRDFMRSFRNFTCEAGGMCPSLLH